MRTMLALIGWAAVLSPAMAEPSQRERDVAAGEARLAKLTAGLVPGAPRQCAPYGRWTGSSNIEGVGILYEYGRERWLNRMDRDCASFSPWTIAVTVAHGALCRGDPVTFVDSGTRLPTGSCILGDYVPYTPPKR